jgi:hypothetical protein
MTPLVQGLVSGLAFGAITTTAMAFAPLKFDNKAVALTSAFINRFGIGLIIPLLNLSQSGWLVGAGVGLLLSLPPALITKAYAPILGFGVVGGAIIGGFTHGWN